VLDDGEARRGEGGGGQMEESAELSRHRMA